MYAYVNIKSCQKSIVKNKNINKRYLLVYYMVWSIKVLGSDIKRCVQKQNKKKINILNRKKIMNIKIKINGLKNKENTQ